MFVANLMVAFLLGQVQSPGPELDRDPSALVAQSARIATPTVRRRPRPWSTWAVQPCRRFVPPGTHATWRSEPASGLIQKIEGALLTQPTRVRLDFDGMPLTDVVRSISVQAGFKVALFPENLPRWRSTRVTLHTAEPVDFWRAVDQLREVAGLQYNPGMSGYAGQREPTFSQADGTIRAHAPISDHGPFRVSLLGLHYQRDVNYDGTGAVPKRPVPHDIKPPVGVGTAGFLAQLNPVANVQFSARLLVAAEPRLSLYQNGPLQLIEAVDNRGNSLIPIASDGPAYSRFAGYFGMANGRVMQLQAQLHRPESAGESIKMLRGTIPVTISSRKPDPLVVSLTNGIGKTVENSEVQLTVHDMRTLPNNHNSLVELSVRPNDLAASVGRGDVDGFSAVLERPSSTPANRSGRYAGQLIPWFPSGADNETARVTLTLTNLPQTTQPKELRYYTLTRAIVSLPFEFKGLVMP